MKLNIFLFCGLPLSGKSTLAKELAGRLRLPFIDIDNIRHSLFQNPQEEMEREKDREQVAVSYRVLFLMTEYLIKLGHSLVITATFSREGYHQEIISISERNKVPIKAIYCFAPDEVIKERLIQREINKDSFSTCRTWEHYVADKARYKFIPLPLLEIDTSEAMEENLEKLISFLKKDN